MMPATVMTFDIEAIGKIVFSADMAIFLSMSAWPKAPSNSTASSFMIRAAQPAIWPSSTKRRSVS